MHIDARHWKHRVTFRSLTHLPVHDHFPPPMQAMEPVQLAFELGDPGLI